MHDIIEHAIRLYTCRIILPMLADSLHILQTQQTPWVLVEVNRQNASLVLCKLTRP